MVLGTSSGIHAWHDHHYIRRIRVGKNESIYQYLSNKHPELVEDDYFRPSEQAVISIPQKSPWGAILRSEAPLDLLERVKRFSGEWVKAGHRSGSNTHNVSATVSVKDDEWKEVGEWMWKNRDSYNGLSVLPYDGGSYVQAPFEECTKYMYDKMMDSLTKVDLTRVTEVEDNTDLKSEPACAGGACEVDFGLPSNNGETDTAIYVTDAQTS